MRIVSLLPAATEILYAIGAGESVVGVTHECDFPVEAARKPILIRPRVDPHAAPEELDRQVRELVERGESIYAVDAELLVRLKPDLIVTQDLCHVCAASPDLAAALARLPAADYPRVLTFTPHVLADVWRGIREIGAAAERGEEAQELSRRLETAVAEIAGRVAGASERPRVLCLEWLRSALLCGALGAGNGAAGWRQRYFGPRRRAVVGRGVGENFRRAAGSYRADVVRLQRCAEYRSVAFGDGAARLG